MEVAHAAGDLRALIGRISRRLRQEDTADEISLSQASVLKLLERHGPATPGALAVAERISPQSMGATLATLETVGLVSRAPDPDDGRRVVMTLTSAGEQALNGVRRNREERMARALTDGFTAEERQAFIAALPLLDRLARLL
jgi:DNA-binding MarR family transcriptional regulator